MALGVERNGFKALSVTRDSTLFVSMSSVRVLS